MRWSIGVINSGSTMQIRERVVSEPSDFCTSEPKVSNSVWTKAGGTGRHPSRLSFDALIRSCCDGFQENDTGWQESFELPLEFAPYFFDLDVGTVYEWDGLIAVYIYIYIWFYRFLSANDTVLTGLDGDVEDLYQQNTSGFRFRSLLFAGGWNVSKWTLGASGLMILGWLMNVSFRVPYYVPFYY